MRYFKTSSYLTLPSPCIFNHRSPILLAVLVLAESTLHPPFSSLILTWIYISRSFSPHAHFFATLPLFVMPSVFRESHTPFPHSPPVDLPQSGLGCCSSLCFARPLSPFLSSLHHRLHHPWSALSVLSFVFSKITIFLAASLKSLFPSFSSSQSQSIYPAITSHLPSFI